MRLIDADALEVVAFKDRGGTFSDGVQWILKKVDALPTIEPRKGKCKRVSADRYVSTASYVFKCDQCGANFIGHWNFCPNCGADMREEQDDE